MQETIIKQRSGFEAEILEPEYRSYGMGVFGLGSLVLTNKRLIYAKNKLGLLKKIAVVAGTGLATAKTIVTSFKVDSGIIDNILRTDENSISIPIEDINSVKVEGELTFFKMPAVDVKTKDGKEYSFQVSSIERNYSFTGKGIIDTTNQWAAAINAVASGKSEDITKLETDVERAVAEAPKGERSMTFFIVFGVLTVFVVLTGLIFISMGWDNIGRPFSNASDTSELIGIGIGFILSMIILWIVIFISVKKQDKTI